MNFNFQNTDVLLSEAVSENLYVKLVEQINKDFNFANESVDFSTDILPNELKSALTDFTTSISL